MEAGSFPMEWLTSLENYENSEWNFDNSIRNPTNLTGQKVQVVGK